VETVFRGEKRTQPASGVTRGGWLLPAGLPVEGYEIHHGVTAAAAPLVDLAQGPDGAVEGAVAGSYLHGLLDRPEPRRALLDALRARRGLDPLPPGEALAPAARRARQYDAIADVLERHLDLATPSSRGPGGRRDAPSGGPRRMEASRTSSRISRRRSPR